MPSFPKPCQPVSWPTVGLALEINPHDGICHPCQATSTSFPANCPWQPALCVERRTVSQDLQGTVVEKESHDSCKHNTIFSPALPSPGLPLKCPFDENEPLVVAPSASFLSCTPFFIPTASETTFLSVTNNHLSSTIADIATDYLCPQSLKLDPYRSLAYPCKKDRQR